MHEHKQKRHQLAGWRRFVLRKTLRFRLVVEIYSRPLCASRAFLSLSSFQAGEPGRKGTDMPKAFKLILARLYEILRRQDPPQWGKQYDPAIRATREEAPSTGRSRPAFRKDRSWGAATGARPGALTDDDVCRRRYHLGGT